MVVRIAGERMYLWRAVDRQRKCLAALMPADFEDIEVAADQADPNEKC
jgi:hypothetical protein